MLSLYVKYLQRRIWEPVRDIYWNFLEKYVAAKNCAPDFFSWSEFNVANKNLKRTVPTFVFYILEISRKIPRVEPRVS